MSKHLASQWLSLADRLSNLKGDFRAKNIAICLASAYRKGWSASRKEEVEEGASATARIKELEDLLAFDKHAWQFHEPSYAAMCLSEQQISLGKFCEYMRGLRDGKKDAIVQGIKPLVELEPDAAAILLRTIAAEAKRTGSWTVPVDLQERIAAWVAERGGPENHRRRRRQGMSEYSYTCACCGKHWHATSTGRKPTKADIARMVCQPCREAPKRIAALEAENAALRAEVEEHNASFDLRWKADMRAIKAWREANPGNELVLPDCVDLCTWLLAEWTALREDKERLVQALEEIAEGDGCNCRVGPGCDWKCKDIAHSALRAARKEEPPVIS